MSAPITEAHVFTTVKVGKLYIVNEDTEAAQAIADSEARATRELQKQIDWLQLNNDMLTDNPEGHARALKERSDLIAERDQLRAEVASLTECDRISRQSALSQSKRAETAEREVEKYKAHYLEEETMRRNANAANDQVRAEVERLRSDRDCEKRLRKDAEELREDAIERAERAEVTLADPQQLHAHCLRTLNEGQIAHLFGERMTEIVNRAMKAEAELAKERARLDWLESDAGVDWQWSDAARAVSRASIDAFMKEETK